MMAAGSDILAGQRNPGGTGRSLTGDFRIKNNTHITDPGRGIGTLMIVDQKPRYTGGKYPR
jgi:hypothetical protein